MIWSSGKGWHWPLKFTENPPTLANISTSNLIILFISKQEQVRANTTQLANNDKICSIKLKT
jgi:hypothetical protein